MEKIPVVTALIGGLSVIGIMSFFVWHTKKRYTQSRFSRVEVRIHNAEVGQIIGRCGEQLKNIIKKSGAKIKFILEDDSYDYCLCIIEGDDSGVQKAQLIIYQILEQCAEIDINSCFLIEKDADNSFAFLSNELEEFSRTEDNEHQSNNLQHSLKTDSLADRFQKLETSNDGLIPVYVSAVATPESFWVQNVRTKEHIELDRLTEEMSEFYKTNPEFNLPPRFADVKIGDICATYSSEDNRWYRVEIAEIFSPNDSNIKDTLVDIYFLDYGISSYQKVKHIRKIPKKFLALKFQAVDCGLAHVQPNSLDGTWSPQALSFFEDITHLAQWHILMARIDYEDESGRPQLTLIDTNSKQDVNIADELVNKGFAKYILK